MRKKELLTRIEALERKIAQQADLIEQLRLGQMKFGPGVVKPAEPLTPWSTGHDLRRGHAGRDQHHAP